MNIPHPSYHTLAPQADMDNVEERVDPNAIIELERRISNMEHALISLAIANYELEDALYMSLKYPYLLRRLIKQFGKMHTPLHNLHPAFFLQAGKPLRPVPSDILESSVYLEQHKVISLIEDGFQSTAGRIVSDYLMQQRTSYHHRFIENLVKGILITLGLILSTASLVSFLIWHPIISLGKLFGTKTTFATKTKVFLKEWYPIIYNYLQSRRVSRDPSGVAHPAKENGTSGFLENSTNIFNNTIVHNTSAGDRTLLSWNDESSDMLVTGPLASEAKKEQPIVEGIPSVNQETDNTLPAKEVEGPHKKKGLLQREVIYNTIIILAIIACVLYILF